MKNKETVYSVKGDKVDVKKCPHCESELVVDLGKDGIEVFTCNSCKFIVKKKKKK